VFERTAGGVLNQGTWVPAKVIGVAQLLETELRRTMSGSPASALSPAGRSFLANSIASRNSQTERGNR
jgi:hypothetical protein